MIHGLKIVIVFRFCKLLPIIYFIANTALSFKKVSYILEGCYSIAEASGVLWVSIERKSPEFAEYPEVWEVSAIET